MICELPRQRITCLGNKIYNGTTLTSLQTSIIKPFSLSGIGVHTGRAITARIEPAEANTGICFWREDIYGQNNKILAHVDNTVSAMLCTRIENDDGIGINTIEHFMSALFGVGIDNANIFVDGPEMPIMDGSAGPCVFLLQSAGIEEQSVAKKFIRIKREIRVEEDDKFASFLPLNGFKVTFTIDIDHPVFRGRPACAEVDFCSTSFVR